MAPPSAGGAGISNSRRKGPARTETASVADAAGVVTRGPVGTTTGGGTSTARQGLLTAAPRRATTAAPIPTSVACGPSQEAIVIRATAAVVHDALGARAAPAFVLASILSISLAMPASPVRTPVPAAPEELTPTPCIGSLRPAAGTPVGAGVWPCQTRSTTSAGSDSLGMDAAFATAETSTTIHPELGANTTPVTPRPGVGDTVGPMIGTPTRRNGGVSFAVNAAPSAVSTGPSRARPCTPWYATSSDPSVPVAPAVLYAGASGLASTGAVTTALTGTRSIHAYPSSKAPTAVSPPTTTAGLS